MIAEGTGALGGFGHARIERGHGVVSLSPDGSLAALQLERTWREQGPRCLAGHDVIGLAPGASDTPPDALWLHVSPDIEAGARVTLLGGEYVIERGLELDVGNATIPALLAQSSGEGERDAPDDFAGDVGRFRTLWTDEIWFDAATGRLLRRDRIEIAEPLDEGHLEDGFEARESLQVLDAAYLPEAARVASVELAGCTQERGAEGPVWWRVGMPVGAVIGLGAGLLAWRRRLVAGAER